ncbi:PxKF domain-containing protein [Candidatus Acetothermia bacterium]|nr:PxKF domain-containing protein [Candidatus Acetothermia bacterium]
MILIRKVKSIVIAVLAAILSTIACENGFAGDTTPPVVSCGSGPSGWVTHDVQIQCQVTDPESGVREQNGSNPYFECCFNFDLSTYVEDEHEDANVFTNSITWCNSAGLCTTAGPLGPFKIDKKYPTYECDTLPSGWQSHNVSVHCSAQDWGSGLANPSDSSFELSTPPVDGYEYAELFTPGYEICDNVNLCIFINSMGPIMVDMKAPQLAGCDSPDGNWHVDDVTLYCTYTDGGSGPTTQRISLSTNVPASGSDENAAASAHGSEACDTVGNCAPPPPDIAGNKVDKSGKAGQSADTKGPIAFCVQIDGKSPTFTLNQSGATVSVSVSDSGSGVEAPSVSIGVSTSTPGNNTVTITVQDLAGNTTTIECPYIVDYKFGGFSSPKGKDPNDKSTSPVPSFALGSAIPIKWQLSDANAVFIKDVAMVVSLKVAFNANCKGSATGEPVELLTTEGRKGLIYDTGKDLFSFNWSTQGLKSGCYNIMLGLNDGTVHELIISLAP